MPPQATSYAHIGSADAIARGQQRPEDSRAPGLNKSTEGSQDAAISKRKRKREVSPQASGKTLRLDRRQVWEAHNSEIGIEKVSPQSSTGPAVPKADAGQLRKRSRIPGECPDRSDESTTSAS